MDGFLENIFLFQNLTNKCKCTLYENVCIFMMTFHLIIFSMSIFIDKFAEQLKLIIYVQNIILKLVHVIRKRIKFCTYRQVSDSNVKCHIFILQWIIDARDTH